MKFAAIGSCQRVLSNVVNPMGSDRGDAHYRIGLQNPPSDPKVVFIFVSFSRRLKSEEVILMKNREQFLWLILPGFAQDPDRNLSGSFLT